MVGRRTVDGNCPAFLALACSPFLLMRPLRPTLLRIRLPVALFDLYLADRNVCQLLSCEFLSLAVQLEPSVGHPSGKAEPVVQKYIVGSDFI